ncbi:MAG: universal stress protein [Sphaerochaetaceae bacterium]|jgi:nucleotide-binding universal stress UspA family protein|nr:universal stress protein [Sphaerochaetaceae bacterium]HHU88627.1 universal stress protein [Spirochaetales bacterium]
MERAIVATDLSEASDVLVEHLGFLKEFGVKSLLLLQCPDYQEIASEIYPYVSSIQNDAIEQQQRVLEKLGFEVEIRISIGNAKREINRIAEAEAFPLIVIGSQGRSLLGGAFLGGVAHEVMLNAQKPLLIVRLALNKEREFCVQGVSGEGVTNHILYATDFSQGAEATFNYLEELVAEGGVGKVTLFHVQDRSRIEPYLIERLGEFNRIDTERLEELKGRLEANGKCKGEVKLVYGDPHTEIIDEIYHGEATLVMLGTQGRSFFKELFAGSVSQFIARRSPIPVLLVPIPIERGEK